MRNLFITLLIALYCACISCDNNPASRSGNENSNAQKNIEAWHTVSMVFSSGNTELLDNVIAEDYMDHTPGGDFKGRDHVKANVGRMRANYKDVKMKIIKELADDEYGFFWMQFNGNKVDATGAASVPFELTSIQVVKFNDGKAVEPWEYFDPKMFQERTSTKIDSSKGKNRPGD